MPSIADTPLVVLVHGAWHGAWGWAALQAELDSRSIASLAVDLPGHGASAAALTDLPGDAAHVVDVVARRGRPVVLVGHSYGGAVISSAGAHPALTGLARHLVYVTAFALNDGESVRDVIAAPHGRRILLADAMIGGDDGTTTVDPALAVAALYGDCPAPSAAAAVARLDRQSMVSFVQPVQTSALGTIPSTYVRCTLDEAIHIDHQDLMAARCDDVVTIETDHSPFLGRPAQLADVIERIVGHSS